MKKYTQHFKFYLQCILICSASLINFTQSQTIQSACIKIGGISEDRANAIVQTPDSGFVLAGAYTHTLGGYTTTMFVVKINKTGVIQWTKTFRIGTYASASSIILTTDGGYALTGQTINNISGSDVLIAKLDATGTPQWIKTVETLDDEFGGCIVQTTDGGYAIIGSTGPYNWPGDVLLIKLSGAGALQFTKTYGNTGDDFGYSIIQTPDGGFAFTGKTNEDVSIIKTDAAGAIQWNKTVGGSNIDWGSKIIQPTGGGFAIAGNTRSFGAGSTDMYFIKVDSSGNMAFTKTVGGISEDNAVSVLETISGSYIITGSTYESALNSYNIYTIKITAAGNLQWSKSIGESGNEYSTSLVQTTDGGFALAGITYIGSTNGDMYFLKMDSMGVSCCTSTTGPTITGSGGIVGTPTLTTSSTGTMSTPAFTVASGGIINSQCITAGLPKFNNYKKKFSIVPNPNNGQFNIQFNDDEELPTSISIQNILGQVVLNMDVTTNNTQVDLNEAPKGIYMVLINYKEYTFTKKIIKQ